MLTYPGRIALPESTLDFLTEQLKARRDRLGTWRKLPAREQALLVLAHLRNGDTYERLADGFGIGVATVYRYVHEAVDLLADLARSLTAALWALAWTWNNFAVLDGTVVRTDRLGALNKLYYSGKHKHHGVNLQGLTDPYGRLLWISDGLPGSTHDLKAARHHDVLLATARAGLYLYVDKGYVGGEGDTLLVPYKGRNLPDHYKESNRAHAVTRAHGERGFAVLKTWKILSRFRGCPRRVGTVARAILTLEHAFHE
ncbi:DDE endonuclease [Frankia sp. AiPs1]|uniref:transposase family protein n=1 Tax=Frankia sp. AiPa1 TaxID=573492 RepID=UPI00202B9C8D|nr:transposase family protein [Frankia sp. AiPa1]MCL9758434.1 transposase family protein [Frankia sp. AiPa1]